VSGTQPVVGSEAPEGLASQRPWTAFSALDVDPATPARRRLATNAERQAECLLIIDLVSVSFLPALVSIKFLAAIFVLLFSASAVGQVIDFGNVNPDQGAWHGGPITASGPDGVQVTVDFINIETSDVVTSGLYSASDCNNTAFYEDDPGETRTFAGDATAGCATSDQLDPKKDAVRLTFSEPVDINQIDLSKFNDFWDDGSTYDKEVRFFEGTPTSTFTANEGDPGPTDFDFSGLMNIATNQVITEFSVGFTDVTQIWFYAAHVNIPAFPDFEDVAVQMNWVVDQIHYGLAAEPPTVTTAAPTSIGTTSATLGGNVTNDGGAQVTERGVVYSTSPDPTTDDNVVEIGEGTGSFSENVTGLTSGTLYYVRAYAINSEDTAYGTQQNFITVVEVTSINRHSPSQELTNSTSVVFEVNLSGPVSGLNSARYSLAESGDVSGAYISSITGSGSTYLVTVNTGSGDGTLRLDVANSTGTSPTIIGLPFTDGQVYTIDKTPPDVTISSAETSPTNASPIPMEIDFSEDVTGFVVGDIAVSGGTLSNFAGSGANYTVDVTPTGDGTVTVDVAAGVAQDAAGNDNTAATQFSIDYDGTAPSVTISSTETSPTNASPIPMEIDFSEDVTGFVIGDIVVDGGTLSNFSGGGASYTADVTPSGDGTITVDVPADVAEDAAGNGNTAATQFSIVSDRTEPTVTISSTETSPTNADPIPVDIDFSEDVTGFVIGDIVVSGGTLSNFSGSGANYTVDVTPPGDGLINVDVPADVAEDEAGNGNVASATFEVFSDRTAPTVVSIQRGSGVDDPTNQSPFDIVITFSEEISDFDVSELSVTNGSATDFSTADNINFNVEITPDDVTSSSNTLEIGVPAGAFTDLAGNENEPDSENFTIEFGDTRPTAVLISAEPNPTNADDFELSLSVTEIFGEAVSSISASDFTITRANIINIDDTSNPVFVLTVEPQEEGEISIQLNENVLSDVAGNLNEASNEFTITYDVTAPQVVISSDESGETDADEFVVTFSFDQPVFGFEQGDIVPGNAQLSGFIGSDGDAEYSVTVSPEEEGLVTIDVPEGVAEDAAGNDSMAAEQFSILFDVTPPSVSISSSETSPTNTDLIPVSIDFSEDVTGFVVSDIVVSGATLSNFAGGGANYTVDVTPTGDGTITVDVPADVAQDAVGNGNTAAIQFSIVYDGTAPTVTLSSVHETTSLAAIPVSVQFSETVTGFTAGDIDVVNGSVDPASFVDVGDGEFTVDVNPDDTDPGLTYDIVVSIPAAAAQDLAGNPSEASDEDLVITFDSVVPGVVISADPVNEFDGDLYTNADAIAITIVFDRPVWGFEGADIGIDNGTWSNFTGDDGDTEFTVTIEPPTGTGPEVMTISIDAGIAEDEAGNENTAAEPLLINWDQNRPAPVISTTAPAVTGDSPIPVVVDFGKPVQAFTVAMAEAAVSSDDGATFSIQNLATNDDEVFTFDLVPDSDDVFSIELAEAVVQDRSGNDSLASNAVEITFDSDRPVISFHAVEEGGAFSDEAISSPTSADEFTLYISFSKPVIGFVESMLDQTNALLSEFSEVDASEGLYSVSVAVIDEGEVSISIAEGAVQDEAGNDNQEAVFTIESDQSAPEVVAMVANIEPAPINPGFTNVSTFELELQFSKPIADFDVGVLIVENASVALLDEDNQQNFTLEVTADAVTDSAHAVSVEVPEGGFSDEAGNPLGNSETFSIVFGDVRPTAQFTTTAEDPTDQEPIAVTLTITEIFGEEVSGFDVSDIDTENVASIEWVGGTNPVFELEITPEAVGDSDITLSLPGAAVSDVAGNESEPSGVFTISVTQGMEPLPVPVAGPWGLMILALLTLAMGVRSHGAGRAIRSK
jgi:hypothetical protein